MQRICPSLHSWEVPEPGFRSPCPGPPAAINPVPAPPAQKATPTQASPRHGSDSKVSPDWPDMQAIEFGRDPQRGKGIGSELGGSSQRVREAKITDSCDCGCVNRSPRACVYGVSLL